MFQKLYRHLEEVNGSLEEVNSTLRRQETAAGNAGAYDKEILQQLQQLNENAKLAQKELKQAARKPSRAYSIVLLLMICLALGEITFLHIRLSKVSQDFATSRVSANSLYETQSQKTFALYNVPVQQNALAAQLARLDTIINQQNQSLLELKDLNRISVRTFQRLNIRIDQTEHQIKLLQSDSTR